VKYFREVWSIREAQNTSNQNILQEIIPTLIPGFYPGPLISCIHFTFPEKNPEIIHLSHPDLAGHILVSIYYRGSLATTSFFSTTCTRIGHI
jgi:hypothetical protein